MLGLVACASVWADPSDRPADPDAKSHVVPESLAATFQRLVSEHSTLADRRSAAAHLLEHESRHQATPLLTEALSAQYGAGVWGPTLETLALHPVQPPDALRPALLAMDERVDGALRPTLAAALGRLMDDQLAKTLAARAQDSARSSGARQTAILALGHHRTQSTAALLLALTEPKEPAPVQEAAFTALQTLTGLVHPDGNREAWTAWWSEARRLSEQQWRDALLANLGRRTERQQRERTQLASRLQEVMRQQYRALEQEQRSSALAALLNDALGPVRELAISLAVQRLVDGGSFEEPLRVALRSRLDDPEASIRQRATLLLRDLADGPAADRVAQRLASDAEATVAVLRANLLMLTRLPRAAAIEPAVALLDHPALRGEAAGMLAAATEAGLVNEAQRERIAAGVRSGLDRTVPLPDVVWLLGRVGSESDWQRIATWLDSADGAVKQAAARAWAQSDRPLTPLATRADDPQIGPVFVLAAARRGHTTETLKALVAHRPTSATATENWQRALVSVAERAPVEAVIAAADELETAGVAPAVREAMLTASVQRSEEVLTDVRLEEVGPLAPTAPSEETEPAVTTENAAPEAEMEADAAPALQTPASPSATPDVPESDANEQTKAMNLPLLAMQFKEPALLAHQLKQHARLLVARGWARLEAERAAAAQQDFQAVVEAGEALPSDLHEEAQLGLIRAHLYADEADEAGRWASTLLTEHTGERSEADRRGPSVAAVVACFIEEADRQLQNDAPDEAQQVIEALRAVVADADQAVRDQANEQLAPFERQLREVAERNDRRESTEDAAEEQPEATGSADDDRSAVRTVSYTLRFARR